LGDSSINGALFPIDIYISNYIKIKNEIFLEMSAGGTTSMVFFKKKIIK
jgi:hypothetical protein